jgi:hypothetical protein
VAVDGTRGGLRLASPATANVLGIAGMALFLASGPLEVLSHYATLSDAGWSGVVVLYASYVVGWVVARRQPRNPVGWILLGFAVLLAVGGCAGSYSVLIYRFGHGALPLGPVAVLLNLLWAPALVLLPVAILLFPDGTLPSPRWRWVLWAYLLIGAAWPVSIYAVAVSTMGHHIQVDASGNLTILDQPHGSAAWLTPVQEVILPVLVVFWLLFIGGQVATFRRSSYERRQQLKWLLSGAVVCLLGVIVSTVLGTLATHPSALTQAALGIGGVALGAFPLGIGVGILKYRLYDIDRIISRTLAYAIVTGLLVGVYAGLVLLVTHVLTVKTPVAVAVATLAAAALFSPLRSRVQQMVDRRFNRARYDADRIVAAFAVRLQDAVDLDAVQAALLAVAHQALEPEHASVWIDQHGLPI